MKIKIDGFNINVEGHADYAEYGKDIVCASITTLMYQYKYLVETHKKWLKECEYELKEGKAEFRVIPKLRYKQRFKVCTDGVFYMIKQLSFTYPQYIEIG